MATNRYVRPSGRGWNVVKEGHRRGTVQTATKQEAIARARDIVRNAGGGEVRVMNTHGKLTAAATIPAKPISKQTRSNGKTRTRTTSKARGGKD